MYCPECGIEERQANQFCRACGTDLRNVRVAVETPDSITASAVSARDEIGRAVAAKIRETQGAYELKKVAEDVLPEIEKFLESPEEKRMRRMRTGMIISMIGLGAAIGITLASMRMNDRDVIFLAGLGVVAFFIGLAFVLVRDREYYDAFEGETASRSRVISSRAPTALSGRRLWREWLVRRGLRWRNKCSRRGLRTFRGCGRRCLR